MSCTNFLASLGNCDQDLEMFPSSSLVAGRHKLEDNEILKTHIFFIK
jgi:hypothetical protein